MALKPLKQDKRPVIESFILFRRIRDDNEKTLLTFPVNNSGLQTEKYFQEQPNDWYLYKTFFSHESH